MPMYDRRCPSCQNITLDHYEPVTPPEVVCEPCQVPTERVYLPGKANAVIGDEVDVVVHHGLCHSDGSPRRFRSRQEMARVAKAKGLRPYVRHATGPGSDKSKFTSKWV